MLGLTLVTSRVGLLFESSLRPVGLLCSELEEVFHFLCKFSSSFSAPLEIVISRRADTLHVCIWLWEWLHTVSRCRCLYSTEMAADKMAFDTLLSPVPDSLSLS